MASAEPAPHGLAAGVAESVRGHFEAVNRLLE